MGWVGYLSATRYMKVKRMGIKEILRSMAIFCKWDNKSSSKQQA